MWKVAVAIVLCCVHHSAAQGGSVTVLGDMTVTGAVRTTAIRAQSLTIDGSISVTHGISGESLQVSHAQIGSIETVALSSPTGTVRIEGELSLGEAKTEGTTSVVSFLQQDVRQWALVHHDDFEKDLEGWSTKLVGSCDGNDHHIAGHCNDVNGLVKKTYTGLGEHKFVRLQARYHFLDSWEGETAFAKIGDRIVWQDVNDVRGMHPNALNACGGNHPDMKLSVPIDVTVPHTGDSVEISFGSTLDEHPCNESFGVDDVMLSVR
eukprot:c45474_g1_i1.p1 GENE.c45474_g1_i1~~c45474_g1_i1.p1  ORF type:complete len:277 (+),score=61.19 c45474_g1_i1:41-832(+)